MRSLLALPLAAALLSGCTARAVLYPNAKYKEMGKEASHHDLMDCERQAEQYVKDSKADRVAGDTARGATVGAAAGAASGAVFGSLGRGAASGGIGGAVAGLVTGLFRTRQPSPIHKSFVHRCLADRGYEVMGWQ
jgi:outer membrane lipoprotein SlyB